MYGEAVADGAMGADLNAMIINCCCSPSSCISRFNRFHLFKVIRLAHWRPSLVRAVKSSSDSLLCGTITPSTFSHCQQWNSPQQLETSHHVLPMLPDHPNVVVALPVPGHDGPVPSTKFLTVGATSSFSALKVLRKSFPVGVHINVSDAEGASPLKVPPVPYLDAPCLRLQCFFLLTLFVQINLF